MTRTTSGIEPVFMPVYKRRRKVNPGDPDVRVDYVDETGDAFEEYVVYHPKFIDWMKTQGIEVKDNYTQEEIDALVARTPYAGATANDIDCSRKYTCRAAYKNGSTIPYLSPSTSRPM